MQNDVCMLDRLQRLHYTQDTPIRYDWAATLWLVTEVRYTPILVCTN